MLTSEILEKKYSEAMQKTNEVYEKYSLKWGDDIPQTNAEEFYQATFDEMDALIAWQNQLEKEIIL